MAKNIFYQFQTSIEQSMCLNGDKHSIKKTDTSDHRIFSFASRQAVYNTIASAKIISEDESLTALFGGN